MNRLRVVLAIFSLTITFFMLPTAQAADIEVSDTCSVADAITAANKDEAAGSCPAGNGADTITLSSDITLSAALPHITTEITIEGEGFTISGDDRFRIFVVNGGTLTVNDLTMTKGKADWGGAIVNVNDGTLTINDSTISHSQAPEGGAIGNEGDVTITNSELSNNSAAKGGAIYSIGGTLHITGSAINRNKSKGDGGAIYHEDTRVQITDATFTNNKAIGTFAGGAALYSTRGSVEISTSVFTNNAAGFHGGAMYADDGSTMISSSAFIANESGDNAGAIYQSDRSLRIKGSSFEHNNAAGTGGAIHCQSCALDVVDTRINHNNSDIGGGGVWAVGVRESMKLVNCTIFDNRAGKGEQRGRYKDVGGGVHADINGSISNCFIGYNTAQVGGGIVLSGDITVANSVIVNNTAQEEGGGIYVLSGDVLFSHVAIVNNIAINGGGLYKSPNGVVNLRNTIISGNAGGDCFGRLAENIGNLIADGSCFADLMGDPMLGDLVEPEDGSPAYFPLLEGSPAIDAADDEFCPDTDITGTPRPQGDACDIGAFELPQ